MKKSPFKLLRYILLLIITTAGCNEINSEEEQLHLETDPYKIITGRWERTKYFDRRDYDSGKKIYKDVEKPGWLEFSKNGEMKREYYDDFNVFTSESGKYKIDSLLHFEDLLPEPWCFEFIDNNNSLILSNAFPAITSVEFIYKRKK